MINIYTDATGSWYGGNNALNITQQKYNAKAIVNYLQNISPKKWSTNSICAILGNMTFESGLNPQRQEVGGSGYGLAQWAPKSNLQTRAKAIGCKYNTMYGQLAVIEYESDNNIQWIQTSDYPISFSDFIKDKQHSIEWLTGAWLKNYERPADQSVANIKKRTQGDTSHIGSEQWTTLISDTANSVDLFLKWCERIANNDTYLYKYGSAHGVPWSYDGVYFDCSSFVSFGLHAGGYDLKTQFTTANQKDELRKLGFKVRAYKNRKQLKRGDIVFYRGHTEVIFENDENGATKVVGAHTDENPPADQISIEPYYEGGWTYFARPTGINTNPLPDDPTEEPSQPASSYMMNRRKGMTFVYPKKKE